jgi:hypothetical protein
MTRYAVPEKNRFHWLALATGPDGKSTGVTAMQCECVKLVKDKIDGKLREQMHEGSTGLHWDFPQLRIGLTNEGVITMPVLDIKGEFQAPKKAGGFKRVKVDTFLAATYCPILRHEMQSE